MTFAQPFSDYEILDRVGSGAMGTVFKARHKRLNRLVALKVLKPSLARNKRYVDRLRREARIVAKLSHANIVSGYDLGEEGGYHFFVMEFVHGKSLKEMLGEWGSFPQDRVLDLGMQASAALVHAHQQGVIHRDIKPGNILIDEQNRVKLTDMGLAKGPTDVTITRAGSTVGTPQYISPEQARNPQGVDIRSDLYSLGATLFHMATGVPPFHGETMAEVIAKVLNERAPLASGFNPDVTADFSLVIRKLLAKDPELRYQTPADLLEDLGRVAREESPRVDPRGLDQEEIGGSVKRVQSHRLVWPIAGVAVATIAAVSVILMGETANESKAAGVEWAISLRQSLDDAQDHRERFAILAGAEASVTGLDFDVVSRLREQVTEELRVEVAKFLRRYLEAPRSDETQAWFDRVDHWREPERFFDEVSSPAFEVEFGLSLSSLPEELGAEVKAGRQKILEKAKIWQDRRHRAHLQAFKDYLTMEWPASWAGELEGTPPNFLAAKESLLKGMGLFHQGSDRPSLQGLPDALHKSVTEAWGIASEPALQRIDDEEKAAAAQVSQKVGKYIDGELQLWRTLGANKDVERRVSAFVAQLEVEFPRNAFRTEFGPWRSVDAQIRDFRKELDAQKGIEDARKVQRTLRLAYRTLFAAGDADAATHWLVSLPLEGEKARAKRDRHVKLLRSAHDVRRLICEQILGGKDEHLENVRRHDEREPRQITIRPEDKIVVRLPTKEEVPLPPSSIPWSHLATRAELNLIDAKGKRLPLAEGFALWLYVGGEVAAAERHLDESAMRFFQEEVRAELDAIGPVAASKFAWSLLREPLDRGDAAAIRDAVELYEQFAKDLDDIQAGPLLEQARKWLLGEEQRAIAANFQDLDSKILPAWPVTVGVDRGILCELPMTELRESGLPEGWNILDGELRFTRGNVDLQTLKDQGVSLKLPLGDATAVTLELDLSFPEPGVEPRLYLFEVLGVSAVIGVLHDGSCVAGLLLADDARRASVLHAKLRKLIEASVGSSAGVKILPGARHTLRIEFRRVPGKLWAVDLKLKDDGPPLDAVRLHLSDRLPEHLRILPMQPLTVSRIKVDAHL